MIVAGSRLGPYEILSPLGAGGMGEVWKARDTRLARDVAVKVLPPKLASDPDALARFEREAKAVAALSHPNVLGIYDLGSDAGVTYAAMELLAGETLRQRLAEGPIPQRKALEYALQIAQGLAAAHEKGIVHRDLKPENLFLTSEGRVKILDFGLAKVTTRESGDTHSPTVAASTEPGTVMGTVGYMSPEQVRGRAADARSDLFSLGCVLYEMLSGRKPFEGDSAAETMAAIVQKDPPELADSTGRFPPHIERILRHCLEKRPEDRFDTAHDLAFALETAAGGGATSGSSRIVEAAPKSALRRFLAPLAVVGIALAAFLAGRLLRPARPAAGRALRPVSYLQVTDAPGVETEPTLSPDGKNVVYMREVDGRETLYLLRVGGRNPVPLTADSTADDSQPAFSPDGERIAFRSEREGGGVFVMGSTGESVKRVTTSGYNPTWSPDGREIAVAEGSFMSPTDLGGAIRGEPEPMTTPSLWSGRLSFSRDGSRLAYASLDWRSTLLKVPFDPAAGRLLGPPQAVLKTTQPIRDHQLSPDGQWIAFVQTGGQEDLFVSRVDGRDFRRLTDDAFRDRGPSWAPDGKSISFYSDRSGAYQLWTIRPDGSGLEQLTRSTGSMNFPVWSPDGKQIATKQIGGGWHLVDMASNAFPRPTRPMPEAGTAGAFWPLAWSPDGRSLAGTIARPDGVIEGVAVFSLVSGGFERFDARPGRAWCVPVWLADSRRLLIRDRQGIYLQDVATKGIRPLVSVGGYATGLSLGVSRDNRWITYTETATEGDIWVAELK